MTQLYSGQNLRDVSYCVLDVETTGLDSRHDQIIEIAGVQYTEGGKIETFSSLVKPNGPIPEQITYLTGISDLDVQNAPTIGEVVERFQDFLCSSVVVGHNVNFDAAFLKNAGVKLPSEMFDTLDMAYILEPSAPSYNLGQLADFIGIRVHQSHRALADCMTTLDLFKHLISRIRHLRLDTLAQLNGLSHKSNWASSGVLTREFNDRVVPGTKDNQSKNDPVSEDSLRTSTRPVSNVSDELDDDVLIDAIFGVGGVLESEVDNFESRREQIQMTQEVLQSFKNGSKLLIEAGTGVGKSMAYLIPALKHSIQAGDRVVISTNTITLQDQIVNKDLPIATKVMQRIGIDKGDVVNTVLKGRRNYLCLNRLKNAINRPSQDRQNSLLIAKIIVWLETTTTGDVAEINISRQAHSRIWTGLSAEGATRCSGWEGKCFLRHAREKAESANVIVVNHSLLMSDMITNNSVIPEYKSVVIDEGHHLESKATDAFGFEVSKFSFDEIIEKLRGRDSILNSYKDDFEGQVTDDPIKEQYLSLIADITYARTNLGKASQSLFSEITKGLVSAASEGGKSQHRVIDRSNMPDWGTVETTSQNILVAFRDIKSNLVALSKSLEGNSSDSRRSILMETEALLISVNNLEDSLSEFIFSPSEDYVYWINCVKDFVSLQSALVNVGPTLDTTLFSEKETVVVTSATLSYKNTFDHFEDRTGFRADSKTILGSPFNYQDSTLLLIPNDIPDPRDSNHVDCIAKNIHDAAEAAGGRTVALFTAYNALNKAYDQLLPMLDTSELSLHAQGRTGNPDRIIQSLRNDAGSIVLGTSTFWEGIDLRGDALQVLVITKLPFEVPTDPIVQARSEGYPSPFMDYSLPNAVNRFRQGFGRLIRSKEDVGVVILLDPRIVKSRYGSLFIKALPQMEIRHEKSSETAKLVSNWLGT